MEKMSADVELLAKEARKWEKIARLLETFNRHYCGACIALGTEFCSGDEQTDEECTTATFQAAFKAVEEESCNSTQ